MQALEADADRFPATGSGEPVRVWIENGDGSIARGLVEVISEDGACIRLTEDASVARGEAVAVRISFDRESPTLAATARVLSVRSNGETSECELAWTHTGPERVRLGALVAGLG